MAKDRKKRRASPSPGGQEPKKARRASPSPPASSQRSATIPLRAKSVFRGSKDPYFPQTGAGAASTPTSEDWSFRVQVVSESTDIHTEMFKKAVQGLVKICFPQNILDELGIALVQQHMRERNAPNQNVEKMSEVFRSEMVHRLVWMLAEYLQDTSKVEVVVKSVTAASAALHGSKIGPDILGNVIASLQQLRGRVPENSTKLLANDTLLAEFASDTGNNEVSVFVSVERSQGHGTASSSVDGPPEIDSEPAPAQPVREGKENKVSTSWRWNVEQEDITLEDITTHFHRTVDLFAYHALSVAKQTLGDGAQRKALRVQIESMWTSIHDDEYVEWVESFRKLKDGDLNMLDRVESRHMLARGDHVPATPAPITIYKRHAASNSSKEKTKDVRNRSTENDNAMETNNTIVKHEINPENAITEGQLQAELQETDKPQDNAEPSTTPIFDLLWGRSDFELSMRNTVVQVVMETMNQRVTAETVEIHLFNGAKAIESKSTLKNKLLDQTNLRAARDDPKKAREGMELRLAHWVVANLQSFPELLEEPIIFIYLVPSTNTVLDTMCGPNMLITKDTAPAVKDKLLRALGKRGIMSFDVSGPKKESLDLQISRILGTQHDKPSLIKRGFIEKVLRYLAFENRDKFPELESSVLVRTWERETGQQW